MWFSGLLVKLAKCIKRDQDVLHAWCVTGKPSGMPPPVLHVDFVRVIVYFEDGDPIKWYVPSDCGIAEHIPRKGTVWGDCVVDYTHVSFGKVTLNKGLTVEMALKEVAKLEAKNSINT